MTSTELPAFLVDTVASTRLRRRAGEWDLAAEPRGGVRTGDLPPGDVHTGDAALAAFLMAFPWAVVASQERRGEGVEAVLDLDLAWQDAGGTLGSSRIPGAAQFLFDPAELTATLTIWPNLFTDDIHLYEARGREFDRRLVGFDRAAAVNRSRLRQALLDWESLAGGTIVDADAELVDGVEPHGFADGARPR